MHCERVLARFRYMESVWLTYQETERVDVRSFCHTSSSLPFWATPHCVPNGTRRVARHCVLALEDEIEVAQCYICDELVILFIAVPVHENVVRLDVWEIDTALVYVSWQTVSKRRSTIVNPVLAVQLLYRLTSLSEDGHTSFYGEVRVTLNQREQSILEVREYEDSFLLIVINVRSQPTRVPEVVRKALR